MSSEFTPRDPASGGSLLKEGRLAAVDAGRGTGGSPQNPAILTPVATAKQGTTAVATKVPWPTTTAGEPSPAVCYKCPKCGAAARDVARFCPRCHATLRFECPACGNRQRSGGKCEKCGVDFIKYIGAVVSAKKAEADAVHERLERRSSLIKNLLWLPFNGGISLLRYFFLTRDRD